MIEGLLLFEQRKLCKVSFIFDRTVTGEAYLQMLERTIHPAVENTCYDNKAYYCIFSRMGHHRDVCAFLNNYCPTRCIEQRGSTSKYGLQTLPFTEFYLPLRYHYYDRH